MMKAAVVREFGAPLSIEEVRIPRPGAGQILVKVAACGVCHTDLHAASGDWPVKPRLPFIPGHEGVGYVAALGPGVVDIKEGDRIGVPWLYSACGRCKHCLGYWETRCESQQNTGYSVNGGFAEYVVADANYVGHLPEKLSFIDAAPILCAGVTVYKGLKVTDTKPDDWWSSQGSEASAIWRFSMPRRSARHRGHPSDASAAEARSLTGKAHESAAHCSRFEARVRC